jgi:uroporphyrin-III C-methyltransferase/precorrin-2 dehydrogenase/sirohydrochlorin ferrochelatase
MPSTLPILLKDQSILLIGGGKVALQKAKVLAENEMTFCVITETAIDEMTTYTQHMYVKRFEQSDVEGYAIVIDATGNPNVAQMLVAYKKQHNILLNVVDVPKLCDFYFMALTPNQPLQIAVTSNGASPTVAKFFRDACMKLIPKDIDSYLKHKQAQRDLGIIETHHTLQELKQLNSRVYLVGCGMGDPELLTIKAYKIMQRVDVVLYDHLISEEILALIPEQTKKVFVGKQKGFHSMKQEAINQLILTYASQGFCVARLKSGDPFVFGRGAEELQSLLEYGIKTEVVPGISSSISAPLVANIPITARGYASGFTVVSAHLKGNSVNLDWVDLMHKENHTIVVLMGLSRVSHIVTEAKRLGVEGQKSCAIIANASRKNQQVILTTLETLEERAKQAKRPAILIFGEVVNFSKHLETVSIPIPYDKEKPYKEKTA